MHIRKTGSDGDLLATVKNQPEASCAAYAQMLACFCVYLEGVSQPPHVFLKCVHKAVGNRHTGLTSP